MLSAGATRSSSYAAQCELLPRVLNLSCVTRDLDTAIACRRGLSRASCSILILVRLKCSVGTRSTTAWIAALIRSSKACERVQRRRRQLRSHRARDVRGRFFESADGIVTSRIPLHNLGVHGCLAAILEQRRHTIYVSISPGYVA